MSSKRKVLAGNGKLMSPKRASRLPRKGNKRHKISGGGHSVTGGFSTSHLHQGAPRR